MSCLVVLLVLQMSMLLHMVVDFLPPIIPDSYQRFKRVPRRSMQPAASRREEDRVRVVFAWSLPH